MRRILGLGLLALLTLAPVPADAQPSGVATLTLSGPVTPVAGVSGHRPTAPAGRPEAVEATSAEALEAGAESIIGTDDRERVGVTTNYPNSAVGHLEPGGYLCTAHLIDDNSVLTSAHCAFDASGEPLSPSTFAPGRDRATDPFGTCEVEGAWAPPEYVEEGRIPFDFAVLNLADGCDAIGVQTGTFGLFARSGSFAGVRSTVQGYPGEAVFGTQKRMRGTIARSQKRLIFYPMDTTGGQSGSPLWRQKASGACTGPCALAVHGYGVDSADPGIWRNHNAGIRLTPYRIGQILDIAGQND